MKEKARTDELELRVAGDGDTDLSTAAFEQPVEALASATFEPHDALVGTKLADRYQILSLIGRGATSCVYSAEDLRLSRPVAVKVLHSHLASEVATVRRFEQEVKTASVLTHASAVPIHDSGLTRTGQPFLVMELVEGQTLTDLIQQGSGLELKRAVNIFVQVCACLAAAHERGIIHRDLKPGNLMVSTDANGKDFVRVLDFGIAKILPVQGETFQRLTQSGEMLGSLLYMSPEQCLDEDLDGRSDVYSLGCVMYETLTGKPPICGRTAFETMNKHMTDMPEKLNGVRPDLNLPDAVEKIIFKSIAKKPQQRYQTIQQVEDALKVLLDVLTEKLLQAPVDRVDPLSTSITAVPPATSIAEQARTEVLNARHGLRAATRYGVGSFVLAFVLIVGMVFFDWSGGFFIFVPLCALAFVLCLLFFTDFRRRLPLVERAAFVVQNCLPTKMLVTKVNSLNSGIENNPNYLISLSADNRLLEPATHSVTVKIPLNSRPFWHSMAVASQLEDLSNRRISVDVYLDPDNGKPIAVSIKSELIVVQPDRN